MSHFRDIRDALWLRPKARIIELRSVLCDYPLYVVADEDGWLYNEAGVVFYNHRWQAWLLQLRAKLCKASIGHPADIQLKVEVNSRGFQLIASHFNLELQERDPSTFNIVMDEVNGALFGRPGHERPYRFGVGPSMPFFGAYELNIFLTMMAEKRLEERMAPT